MPGRSVCSVAICKNTYRICKELGGKIIFFQFPKGPIREQWVQKCYRKDKFCPENKKICSIHFKPDDYEDAMRARLMKYTPKKLKKTAIPSLFLKRKTLVVDLTCSPDILEHGIKSAEDIIITEEPEEPSLSKEEPEKASPCEEEQIDDCILQRKVEALENENEGLIEKRKIHETSEEALRKTIEEESNVSKPPCKPLINCTELKMEKENISLNDIESICRTCSNHVISESLYLAFSLKYNNYEFVEILRLCTGVIINENEKLPLKVCTGCISETTRSFDFRLQCEESDARLKRIFIQTPPEIETVLKQEIQIEEIQLDTSTSNEIMDTSEDKEAENKDSNLSSKLEEILPKRKTQQEKQKFYKDGMLPLDCCSKTFETCKEYVQHKKEHPRKRKANYICDICSRSCQNNFKLKQHMRMHTGEKPYQCQVCQRRFSWKHILNRHMILHSGKKPYICETCGRGFAQVSTLKSHKDVHNQELQFLCNHCGKRFRHTKTLKAHQNTHLRETDRVRGEVKKKKNGHIRIRKQNRGIDHRDKHQCLVCLKCFTAKGTLRKHTMEMHSSKTFLCSYCGKDFRNKASLELHTRVHTGERPYLCTLCNKRVSSRSGLTSHMRLHSGERPFVCSDCGQAFKQRHHLKHHQRIHRGEKPYECSVCSKRFALNANLTAHIRTHTREMNFLCSLCDETFYEPRSLKIHQKRLHGVIEEVTGSSKEETVAVLLMEIK